MPPEANAACVCAMEDTLEVSHRPDDKHRPMGCCDAGTNPLVKDNRQHLPAAPGNTERIDDEYERHGTGNLCMMCEPRAGSGTSRLWLKR